ncbi:MAG: hypothetical protein IJB97_05860, partial [Clostridia bacterium]|nr:hypothetical protein [Clostridia bacterium]
IDQTNFVTTVKTASANVSTSYYIMIGDVTLGEADFAVGKGSGTFVSAELHVALDGNGHTLKVEGEFTDTKKGALFYDVNVPVKNLVFKYNVTRTATQTMSQACFAQNMTKTATVVNCYMEANVTPTADGEVVSADVVMFNHLIGNSVNSTVISVNVLDKDGAATGKGAVTNICNGGPVLTVVFINADTTAKLAINGTNGFAKTSYYYTSLANFIAGNGQVSNAANTFITSLTWTATTDKAYAGWDTTVWTIDSTGIKLCGVAVERQA